MREFACIGLMVTALGAHAAAAQSNTGTVFGVALDAQRRAVPGANVTVRSSDSASIRSVRTDAAGRFTVAGLPPGAYTVEVQGGGLKLRRALRLTVSLGSSTQLEVRLEVPPVSQTASVSARGATSEGNTVAPPIDGSEASISSFFSGTVVTYLPNRDRDVGQFTQLAANAHEDEGGVSIDGQRPGSLVTQVDGVDLTSPLLGGMSGAENRSFLLPQTSIREFEVVTSGAAVDAGLSGTALVNVVSKEGSNKPHGEAFYTLRPRQFTSADAFGRSLDNLQSVFGGSLGGPIRKDRSFFYVGLEQEFLHAPFFASFAPQAPGTSVPASLTALQGEVVERDHPLAVAARVDQVLSKRNTLNLELAFDRIRISDLGDGLTRSLATVAHSGVLGGQSIFSRAGLTSLLRPAAVNQLQVSWSDDHRQYTPNSTAPELNINGFGTLGGDSLGAHRFSSGQLEVANSLSVARGRNLLEVGADFANQPSYEDREPNINGRFDYNSLADYLAFRPRRFQQTFVTGAAKYQEAVQQVGLFTNVRSTLRKGMTMTAGMRWQAQRNPSVPQPNSTGQRAASIPSSFQQFQPRLGLAWNPLAKTVIRVFAGIYDAPTPATYFHRVVADSGLQTVTADSAFDPQLLALTGAFSGAPRALAAPPVGLATPHALEVAIDPGFRNASSFQTSASVDQELSARLTLRGAYLHASTAHLLRFADTNLSAPTLNSVGIPVFSAPRPMPGIGRLMTLQSSAHSSYDAFNLGVIAQVSRRTQVMANYTLAATRDDDSTEDPYRDASTLNPYNPKAERAYSNLDQRHNLNVAAILNLPAGFKLNPLIVVHSAAPYTGLTGFDTQNDANDFNDRVLASGLAAPRNLYRGPMFFDTDLRLVKDFTLRGEGHHLDLFMDVFNLTGQANRSFGPHQVSLFGLPGQPLYSAGQPLYAPGSTRLGGPREIQFTARLVAF